jgi:hypothetical protein
MGLILELVDEIIEVRGSRLYTKSDLDLKKGIRAEYFTLRYAIPVVFFQFIDNVVIPYFTFFLVINLMQEFSITGLLIAIVPVFSSLFSLYQTVYYFLFPTETYLSFFSRFLGETAIGCILSALFRIRFKTKLP